MHIEIETEELTADQLTSRKDGTVYYTLEQPALIFTDQSRYPLQFKIRHAFTQNKEERDSIGPIAKGKYLLSDSAFKIGRFGSLELNEINIKHLRVPPAKTT
jgi:hypothetical protein